MYQNFASQARSPEKGAGSSMAHRIAVSVASDYCFHSQMHPSFVSTRIYLA